MNADPYPDSRPFFRKLHVTLSRGKMRVYKYSKLEASYVVAYKSASLVGINGYSCFTP
jgi:hypothetical protein